MVCNVTEDGKTKAITGSGVCEARSGLRNVKEGRRERRKVLLQKLETWVQIQICGSEKVQFVHIEGNVMRFLAAEWRRHS